MMPMPDMSDDEYDYDEPLTPADVVPGAMSPSAPQADGRVWDGHPQDIAERIQAAMVAVSEAPEA